MDIRITPGKLRGSLEAPPSKSHAHRLMTATALAGGKIPESFCTSEDTRATFRCLNELHDGGVLDCGESGTTLRFLLPVAAALGINARFVGRGRLPERPMSALTDALRENGAVISAGRNIGAASFGRVQSARKHQLAVHIGATFRPASARRRERNNNRGQT